MMQFSYYRDELEEIGTITQINHPVVKIRGLPKVKLHELVLFESGGIGETVAVFPDVIDVVVFTRDTISPGTKVVRTNKTLSVAVGEKLLGKVINPFGLSLTDNMPIGELSEEREIDQQPSGIAERAIIHKPFRTGAVVVDMMVPLGKGQKELILGDRKTGKSSFLFTTIKNQVREGTIAIYAAIGKKKSDVKFLMETLQKENLLENTVIVATGSNDAPSLIYLTPFTAMTIAEYFRDQGRDVLIVLDDLSSHAQFYREISLTLRNFPGRDSYPGDIFYVQARLLERAGNFIHPTKGEVAITCLPVVDTVEGDFTSYIVTTLMGITDGHIFFDSNIFYKGRRPAVNIDFSVTRVGRQTQSKVKRDIIRELTSFNALYEKMQSLSHFGAELTTNVKQILTMGETISLFFNQHYTVIVPEEIQLILFCMLWLRFISPDKDTLVKIRDSLIIAWEEKDVRQQFDEIIRDADSFNGLLRNVSLHKDAIIALWKKNTD